jgi:hypothetical protein
MLDKDRVQRREGLFILKKKFLEAFWSEPAFLDVFDTDLCFFQICIAAFRVEARKHMLVRKTLENGLKDFGLDKIACRAEVRRIEKVFRIATDDIRTKTMEGIDGNAIRVRSNERFETFTMFKMFPTRSERSSVFPEPGPAMTMTGPSIVSTAFFCEALRAS